MIFVIIIGVIITIKIERARQYMNMKIQKGQYPESAEKMYFGAFILTPIWALVHKKYLFAIIALIPIIGLVASFMALINGGRWAWDSKDWQTEYYFKESTLKWNIAGGIVLFIMILYYIFK